MFFFQVLTNAHVGGASSFEANVISGNHTGVAIIGGGTNSVVNNKIGTDNNGTFAIGNDQGVSIQSSNGNFVGGTVNSQGTGGFLETGNLISGNAPNDGIVIITSNLNTIRGNFLGTDETGKLPIPNGGADVKIGSGTGNTIGGVNMSQRNVISGQSNDTSSGVFVLPDAGTGNKIWGNFIGTDVDGNTRPGLGNANGVVIQNNGTDVFNNKISNNTFNGIMLSPGLGGGYSPSSNTIRANKIGVDGRNETGVYVAGTNNTIGGESQADGNTIVKNNSNGIWIDNGSTLNTIQKNSIGIMADENSASTANNYGVLLFGSENHVTENTISLNAQAGIRVERGSNDPAAQNNHIEGNMIGTTSTGSDNRGNNGAGILLTNGAQSNMIENRNVISGNTYGIFVGALMSGVSPIDNLVRGNSIGTDINGSFGIPNEDGVFLAGGAQGNIISENLISGNSKDGVLIAAENASVGPPTGNSLTHNTIGTTGIHGPVVPVALPNLNGIDIDNRATGNTIGGSLTFPSSDHEGNLISGNTQFGIKICPDNLSGSGNCSSPVSSSPGGNTIIGNVIGMSSFTPPGGDSHIANGSDGIYIFNSSSNMIGGNSDLVSQYGNVIVGSGRDGVRIAGIPVPIAISPAKRNKVINNYIGGRPDDRTLIPNAGNGVTVMSAPITTLKFNRISGNIGYGIYVTDTFPPPGKPAGRRVEGTVEDPYASIFGNLVGVLDGVGPLVSAANGTGGIKLENVSNVEVGTADPADQNTISSNSGPGLIIDGPGAEFDLVQNNFVGTDQGNDTGFGNTADGILITDQASFNMIGGPGGQ